MADITPILNSTGISLERAAADKFGAAVETFATQNLGAGLAANATGSTNVPVNRGDGSFYASSYAAALTAGHDYRPKQKFLFKVEFVFTAAAMAAYPEVFAGAKSNDFTFMIKAVDRPKITFEYSDDLNYYNFRSKAITRVRHQELTMTFIDDVGNRVLNFFRALMMIYQPITKRQLTREGLTYQDRIKAPTGVNLGSGMEFSSPGDLDQLDYSHRGVLQPGISTNDIGAVIQTIRIHQIYTDPGVPLGQTVKDVVFDFINARLVSFDLEDLSHESSDFGQMNMQFDYDWMEIVNLGSINATADVGAKASLPSIGGAPTDFSPNTGGGASPGNSNPFASIITNQLGRAGQQITSTAVGKAITTIAGNGQFASLINSQVSNLAGGIVGQAGRNLGTAYSGSVLQQVSAAGSSVLNIIRPAASTSSSTQQVVDSAIVGPQQVDKVVIVESDVLNTLPGPI